MRSFTPFLIIPFLFLPTHRKEAAAVRVSVSSAENARFVIAIHGMRVLHSNELFLALRWRAGRGVREQDTIAAPAVLDLSGLGAVDLVPLDTTARITTRIQPILDTLAPTAAASGRQVRIEHATFGAAFTATVTGVP